MTAIAHPFLAGRGAVRPLAVLRTHPAPLTVRSPGGRATAAQFRRRRAAVSLAAAVLLGGLAALGLPGGMPLMPSGAAPAARAVPVARTSYVVHPGDTLWQIARTLRPSGDVRPLVHRLAAGRAAAPLRAGERLVLSPG